MEQKFVSFDEAVEKLGISADRLNDLRESGELRAYRDGKSWKFRRDEIDKLVDEGIPEPPPPSDIGMAELDDLVEAEPLASLDDDDDDDELLLAPEGDDGLKDTDPVSIGTELELAAEEAGDDDGPESILLSEEELGESVTGPASTIIGKDTLDEDADLELVTEDEPEAGAHQSDVRLEAETSDVLSSGIAGSGVLDDLESESASLSAFEDLDELEIDLAAESSRILSPEDTEKAKAEIAGTAQEPDDITLDEDLALDDLELEGDSMGSTDVSAIELEGAEVAKDEPKAEESEIELATDDDLVLSDGSGSDITIDPSESGISLGSPADSGLALDDIPLDAGSSAILSSLSLGGDIGSDPELSLLGGDASSDAASASGLQGAEDFDLTPMSDSGDDDDSSSQVIALDADVADLGGGDEGILEESAFLEEEGDGVVLAEDYGGDDDGMMADDAFAGAPAAVATVPDAEFSTASVLALGSIALLLSFCGIMMLDMVRNIWSWDQPYALNSSLIDALLGLFKLG